MGIAGKKPAEVIPKRFCLQLAEDKSPCGSWWTLGGLENDKLTMQCLWIHFLKTNDFWLIPVTDLLDR